jgi:hypothetical protein
MALARGEPAEHVCYCNPHMSDAGTTAALARLNGYDVLVIHLRSLALFRVPCSIVLRCIFGFVVFRPMAASPRW